ncbi:MAG TPA: PRC-barrel domain-containing protein [Thermomicrobiales bacterium]|nr:PRC-barrel domain-containing protein [Thermomicrobiales bacterium]
MQLDIGSRVKTSDGQTAGKVKRIIFDPERKTVREFVMQTGGLLPSERIVDRQLIEEIEDDTVTIRTPASEIEDLPAFVHAVHMPIFYSDLAQASELGVIRRPGSVPRDAVVLTRGSQVYDRDGEHVGRIDEVKFDADGRVTAFVVETGIIFDRDIVIPIEAVESVTGDRIKLNTLAAKLEPARAA